MQTIRIPAIQLRIVPFLLLLWLWFPLCSMPAEGGAVEDRLSRAFDLVREGDYERAREIYAGVLEKDPENAEALFRMGVLVSLDKDYKGAADYLERAAEQAPERQDVWRRLGEVSMKLGRFEEAARAYNQAHRTAYDRELERKEGVARLEAGELSGASRIFQKLLLGDPGDYHAVYYYGNVLLKQGETDHAARCYEAAITLRPVLVEAYINLAAIRCGQQKYGEAVELLEKTLEVVPRDAPFDPSIRFNLGLAAWKAGDPDKAAENFQEYLKLCPACPEAKNVEKILDSLQKKNGNDGNAGIRDQGSGVSTTPRIAPDNNGER